LLFLHLEAMYLRQKVLWGLINLLGVFSTQATDSVLMTLSDLVNNHLAEVLPQAALLMVQILFLIYPSYSLNDDNNLSHRYKLKLFWFCRFRRVCWTRWRSCPLSTPAKSWTLCANWLTLVIPKQKCCRVTSTF
jgi:hypothetical protein